MKGQAVVHAIEQSAWGTRPGRAARPGAGLRRPGGGRGRGRGVAGPASARAPEIWLAAAAGALLIIAWLWDPIRARIVRGTRGDRPEMEKTRKTQADVVPQAEVRAVTGHRPRERRRTRPGWMFAPVAGRVYEVCSLAVAPPLPAVAFPGRQGARRGRPGSCLCPAWHQGAGHPRLGVRAAAGMPGSAG
jgi:hypothetical protein